ncbi:MAG: gfo/Idh/MocA family oxidoreductase [Bacteroidetes bacterium HGW-Bacteroidetes-3]|nr:MAG: gfo/Idh/MocA family oxidoreductase [Bacteroidetes bacterium HGW-Bacteroidetes-3]
MNRKIKWGIIGLGKIAQKFVNDLILVETAELEAVASRDLAKAEAFAETNHSKKFYGTYEALLQDKLVDIVYIATPHNSHERIAVLALKHQKAVLCEKPFAINQQQVFNMIEASKKNNLFLMEALWTRFLPAIKKIKNTVETGEIGEIKYLNADFSFKANPSIQRIYDKELGGGSILDIGIYPIFLAYLILGIPEKIIAKAHFFESGADSQVSIIFDYKNAQAVLFSSFNSNSKREAKISGTLGEIMIDSPWNEASTFTLFKDNKEEKISFPKTGKGFTHQIEECNLCLLENRTESCLWSHQNSLELITLLDAVRKEIGLTYTEDRLNSPN